MTYLLKSSTITITKKSSFLTHLCLQMFYLGNSAITENTVRSCYNHLMENAWLIVKITKFLVTSFFLWKLKVPPKVKHFMWRLPWNCLPPHHRLQSRGVLSNQSGELLACVFWQWACTQFLARLWNLHHISHGLQESPSMTQSWSCCNLYHRNSSKFAMLFWCIWCRRNNKIWNNIHLQHNTSINLTMQSYAEWCQSRKGISNKTQNQHQQAIQTWQKPREGYIKCNVEAAL